MSDATATALVRLVLLAASASVVAYGALRRGREPREYARSALQLTPLAAWAAVAAIAWHPLPLATPAAYDSVARPLGLAAMLAGWLLGGWAALSLGRYWDVAISAVGEHRVVRSGPFALVRHPIYLGVLTVFAGAAVATADSIAAGAAALSVLLFYLRARAEERFLEARLGGAYREYAERVPMLLPFPRPGSPRRD